MALSSIQRSYTMDTPDCTAELVIRHLKSWPNMDYGAPPPSDYEIISKLVGALCKKIAPDAADRIIDRLIVNIATLTE